jgi:thioredoxin type arsenate reductase
MATKLKILFLCTGNSCRSQMAEGWARQLKRDVVEPYSAGIETHGLNPNAVKVMAEAGVDISHHRSKHLNELKHIQFDWVVTVCDSANEHCPIFPGKVRRYHVSFDDPPKLARNAKTEDEALSHYRRVRDEIRAFVENLPDILNVTPIRLSSTMTLADRYGGVMCRISNKFRMKYTVTPGLYAFGNPDQPSPVLVTGNYRLSLNVLRASLANRNAWILVVDTKGINVWCAAGKGTFCTGEIVKQISACNLGSKISHRTLVLPQLGASGVAAPKLQKASGFTAKFGPVRASDIPKYLDNNYIASPSMRRVRFLFIDRAKLVPMEAIPALKKLGLSLIIAAVLFGITRSGIIYKQAIGGVWPLVIAGLTAIFTGSILTPLLLPFIPGRAFSIKGFVAGLIGAIAIIFLLPICRSTPFLTAFNAVSVPAFSSYLAFLFTGSSTYTSPSGVKVELKIAWPLYLASAAISTVLLILALIRFWGIV